MTVPFDPTRVVEFDLERGQVTLSGAERVLLPAQSVALLLGAASHEQICDFGRLLGTELGRRISDRLGATLEQASVEEVLEHVSGELALMGFGALALERWGKALVATVRHCPLGAEVSAPLLAAVLESLLARAFSRHVSAVTLEHEGNMLRLLITNVTAKEQVKTWLAAGVAWSSALARLQGASI